MSLMIYFLIDISTQTVSMTLFEVLSMNYLYGAKELLLLKVTMTWSLNIDFLYI